MPIEPMYVRMHFSIGDCVMSGMMRAVWDINLHLTRHVRCTIQFRRGIKRHHLGMR